MTSLGFVARLQFYKQPTALANISSETNTQNHAKACCIRLAFSLLKTCFPTSKDNMAPAANGSATLQRKG
jgi:hypothetical protein